MCDAYNQWKVREREAERWLTKRPICDDCEKPVQDETFYLINGECICPSCMENYKKWTEDYAE